MKKAGQLLFFFFLVFPAGRLSVLASKPDTLVSIQDVKVYGQRPLYYQEDKKVISCDSVLVLPSGQESLGELLGRMAPVNLLQYGAAGSLSSLSLRGSSTAQTQVNWNGFPINSLTSGISDLSQINAGMFEEILLIPGASGSLYGSGTAGGAINLDNKPAWGNGTKTTAGFDGGSFGTLGGDLLLQTGTKRFRSKSAFSYRNVQNNFPYRDTYKPGEPVEISAHNRFQYAGFIQTFSFRLAHSISIQSGFWYQKNRKEIPAIMGSYQPGTQEQRDSSLRIYMVLEKRWARSVLTARSAWFLDNMWFTDKISPDAPDYSIDSRFRTQHFMSDIYYRHSAGKHWMLDGGIASSLAAAKVTAYQDPVHDHSLDIYAGTKYHKYRWTGSFTLRQNFNPYKNPLPQADAGIRYAIQPGKTFFRFNFSTKYRIPTLNDKYWTPGGNPDLLPEHGWGVSSGLDLRTGQPGVHAGPWSFRWQMDLFSNMLHDQIRWIPGNGYWYPENVGKMWSYGAENNVLGRWEKNKLSVTCQLTYYYTITSVEKDGRGDNKHNQAAYVPVHTASGILRLDYGILYAGFYEHFTGPRYTTADNDPLYQLNPYALGDMILGGRKKTGSFTIDLRVVISNLFNTNYQVIRSYPMPGRAYFIKARFIFQTGK